MHPLALLILLAVAIAIIAHLPVLGPAGFAMLAIIVSAFVVPWTQPE